MGQSVSSNCSIDRTFSITVYFPNKFNKSEITCKTYRNPIFLAQEYTNMIKSGGARSEADLGRKLGISRVRVNQIIKLLSLDEEIIKAVEQLGDPLKAKIVSERMLRKYVGCPLKDQKNILQIISQKNFQI